MSKPDTLTRVTGVVALSYLIVIPVSGLLVYKTIRSVQKELDDLWGEVGYEPDPRPKLRDLIKIPKLN